MIKLNNTETSKHTDLSKRKLLALGAAIVSSPVWVKPLVNSVVLPAHGQTSMCMTDITVGGPLAGNASGAETCQEACEAEAVAQDAQLCAVRETMPTSGTECSCDLDLP